MDESLRWVVGIIIAFLGISLSMLGTGVSLYYQGKSFAQPRDPTSIAQKLHRLSWVWTLGGFVYIGIILYVIFSL